MRKQLALIFSSALLLAACNQNKVEIIEGVKIQIHSHDDKAKKLKDGDIITFDLVIKNGADSVLQDTKKDGKPGKGMIQAPNGAPGSFKGTFENGLRLLSIGDSATILVPIDSLIKSVQAPLPPFLKPGTDLKYTVKITKVQSRAEFEKEMAKEAGAAKVEAAKRLAGEPATIDAFTAKTGKAFQKSASGLRYFIEKPGTGANAKMGETWVVNYKGTFMSGKVFDQGQAAEMPLGQMIPGFNEALSLLKAGGKGTFVIPSSIAYGDQARGPIEANSVLVFEIELISKK
ncbi:FKBP-type peptidyl-prolyl cis-trans isomerase [Aquirufa sp. ROCK2-A2]